jgi:tRNA (adenine22-N1)-methyltransferase
MGGELIAQILDKSEYAKKQGVRLILQPMTSIKELREYLQNGYSVIDEDIVYQDNKLYQIICVEYDGVIRHYTDTELELGVKNIENGGKEFNMLFEATVKKKEKKLNGLKIGGYDTTEAENEIIELKKIIKGNLK